MYPIPITPDGTIEPNRSGVLRAALHRLGERLGAAANAVVERKNPQDNELSRDYFRFPPF